MATETEPFAKRSWCARCRKWKTSILEECPDCQRAFIALEEHHNWARHYDSVQWTVTGVLLGGSGALAFQVITADEKFQKTTANYFGMIGGALIIMSVISISIFRSLRAQVQSRLPESHQVLFVNWKETFRITHRNLNLTAHICFLLLWIFLVLDKGEMPGGVPFAAFLTCTVVFIVHIIDELGW